MIDNILFEMDKFYTKYGIAPNTIIGNKKIMINKLKPLVRFASIKHTQEIAGLEIIDNPAVKKPIICLRLKEEL